MKKRNVDSLDAKSSATDLINRSTVSLTPLLYFPHLLNVIERRPVSRWLIIHFLLSDCNSFLPTYRWQLRNPDELLLRRTTERCFFKRKPKFKFERKPNLKFQQVLNILLLLLLETLNTVTMKNGQNDQFVIFVRYGTVYF